MLSAFFQLTDACFLNCKYCFYNTGYLSKFSFKKEIDCELITNLALNMKINNAILTGGDPLHSKIFEDTMKIIKIFRSKGIKTNIDTSLAIDDYKTFQVIEHKPDMIFASCDSHIEEIHNAQRGFWKLTYTAILRMIKFNIPITINCVVTLLNYRQIKDIWKFFINLGVIDIDFNLAYIPNKSKHYKKFSCENLDFNERQKLINDMIWCAKQKEDSKRKISHCQVLRKLNH